jgi:serine/threonine protein kinase
MDHDRWRRAEELFHEALGLAPEARPAFLDGACGTDGALRGLVDTLVSRDREAASFLESAPLPAAILGEGRSLLGHQVGPYRILSFLGAGGMGEVYRATDTRLGRDVALKTVPPEVARDAERAGRLRREARILASLNHSNIAAIYGLEESDGVDFLVLELVEGGTLRGPMPLAEALDCAVQVADALEAAHGLGIVHRDLKPANVKASPNGQVKVLDFGVAKAATVKAPRARDSEAAGSDTAAGRIGTPGGVRHLLARCLDKDPGGRPASMTEVRALRGMAACRCDAADHARSAVRVVPRPTGQARVSRGSRNRRGSRRHDSPLRPRPRGDDSGRVCRAARLACRSWGALRSDRS